MSTDVVGRYGHKCNLLVIREERTHELVAQHIRCIDLVALLCADQTGFMDTRKILKTYGKIFYVRRTPDLIGHVFAEELPETDALDTLYFDQVGALIFFIRFYQFARKLARLPVLVIENGDPYSILSAEKEIYEALALLETFKRVEVPQEGVYEIMAVSKHLLAVASTKCLVDISNSIPLAAFLAEAHFTMKALVKQNEAEEKQNALVAAEEAEKLIKRSAKEKKRAKKGRSRN